ncbi:Extracellular protein, gamma-D-glutamate-meso-diaminopimelate muropeptidase [Pediococcus damnosus]|uniref:Extracellular protein, gamma-D-glutamate-meso-diaminopimelate muropeptidase n=1 Tax=Pediococcus damnosus TaxID=51663 RepID=A0A0R2HF25_9LACO|nr:C40 family peptidase [Pediococcus damnosus]AMV60497.1 Extracellular protein, gamma-D-glutamate-meso-diaminopimelate muropeptidase [Pediococcus damnosus]AMV63037.1 Extracellular protein, gamma-D-glutamate-meso-diaminopimelate muropeptidase [Pediococcus damnosus]AMV64812.1 Extracellular protein, gamma-D-glutamate-meso-diaminopimelate muropeptidase [Pediococcus damnosus]AMV67074.1 Extracellular protein, gamma-D-glutamate-meso-diaminopimelate muropeptidase [Pediococcus damnosus]AMV69324.1 Extra
MLKINFKQVLVLTVGVLGITFGATHVASADATAGGNQQYTAEQTIANNETAQAMTTETSAQNNSICDMARSLATRNIPYVWGGEAMSGMDCSGFTEWVYAHAKGVTLGHNTVIQEGHVTKHTVAEAQPGDLLFWGSQGASYHVGIYIGNGKYVAAPAPGQNVSVQTVSGAFMPSFSGHVNG